MSDVRSPEADATVVLIPVLDRPKRVPLIAESILSTSHATPHFVVSQGDKGETAAIRKLQRDDPRVGMTIVDRRKTGDYAFKINRGVLATDAPWIFQGADDLRFHPEWLDFALEVAEATGARVIGTDDLCNPRVKRGRHSTHSLVHRSYVTEVGTVDEPGKMLHEGYEHGFVDDELVYVATRSREFAFSAFSKVEHLHPTRRDIDVPLDATYEKALDRHRHARDRQIWIRRQRLVDPRRRDTGRRMR